jgi:two-component sensor histidine kinase
MVKIFPGLPFDVLIRLEYLSAFLPLPSAAAFFFHFYPGLLGRWSLRFLIWPSLVFAGLTLVLPLDWLTRSIVLYYPLSIPTLGWGSFILVRRILQDGHSALLLAGVAILAGSGLVDTLMAAFFASTGTLVPWGMGIFVVLQATSLARRFLAAFEATEIHLAEKEFLIREVHHRVKNSLQVVASLVTLQANRLEDKTLKEVFQALRRRITAISLVHEKLHSRGMGDRPDVGEYLRDLLNLQYPKDLLEAWGVGWDILAEPMEAGVDYCIDAGLILTELVGNAHKHVLLANKGGQLHIDIRIREGRLSIEVDDDGPGFAPGFQPEASRGLGFRLILSLLQRNDGSLTFPEGPGGRVRVDLSLPEPDPEWSGWS